MDANDIQLIRTANLDPAAARAMQRRARGASLTRIRPGVVAPTSELVGLGPRERHLLLIRASLPFVHADWALSELSAAAVYRWPHIGDWPTHVHVTATNDARTVTTRWFVRHGGLRSHAARSAGTFHGAAITSGAQTVVDLASTLPFAEALVLADVLVSGFPDVRDRLAELTSVLRRNRVRAERVVAHASEAAESPAESLCRARLIEIGAGGFVEQQRFKLRDGSSARVDFWFPEQGVVLEVAGRQKYEDPTMLDGRTTAAAHWNEKLREDAIRSLPVVRAFVRVTWADLMDVQRLRAALRAAGVPCR